MLASVSPAVALMVTGATRVTWVSIARSCSSAPRMAAYWASAEGSPAGWLLSDGAVASVVFSSWLVERLSCAARWALKV